MGKSVACQLAAKGANVVIVARTTSKLKVAVEHIKVRLPFVLRGSLVLMLSSLLRRTPLDRDSTTSVPT